MTTEYPKKAVHATVATNPKIMTANAEMRTACCQPRRKSEDGFGIATSTGAGVITTAVFADIVIQSVAASLPPHLTSAFNVQGSMHNKLYVNFETIKSGHCESKLKMKAERFAMAYRLVFRLRLCRSGV